MLLVCVCVISACNRFKTGEDRLGDLITLAQQQGFVSQRLYTDNFTLQSFHRDLDFDNTIVDVYIEGDGLAWRRKNRLSRDPTPIDSVTFALAKQSARPVIYLARPCQYQTKAELEGCDPRYWSSHRYAKKVVVSLNQVLTNYKQQYAIQRYRLIGYSGGGALAVLIASQRNDVDEIITVAGNLDHEFWTEHHSVSPLDGSLNAIDFANRVKDIPQVHFVGGKDKIIPIELIDRYMQRSGNDEQIKKRIINEFDHRCCWAEQWSELGDKNALF